MRVLVAAALTTLIALPAIAQSQKTAIPGIRNYHRVDATIGCGGAVDPSAMAALRKEGFVSVINLRLATEPGAEIEVSRAAAQAAGLKYIHLPFDNERPDPKVVGEFLAAIADKGNQPAFVHCGSGNRAAAMWMIKRVLKDGWTTERARQEAEALGLRRPELVAFVMDYIAKHR